MGFLNEGLEGVHWCCCPWCWRKTKPSYFATRATLARISTTSPWQINCDLKTLWRYFYLLVWCWWFQHIVKITKAFSSVKMSLELYFEAWIDTVLCGGDVKMWKCTWHLRHVETHFALWHSHKQPSVWLVRLKQFSCTHSVNNLSTFLHRQPAKCKQIKAMVLKHCHKNKKKMSKEHPLLNILHNIL